MWLAGGERDALLEEGRDGLFLVDVVDRLGEQMRHGQLDDLWVVGAVGAQREGVEHYHLQAAENGRRWEISSSALAKIGCAPSLGMQESAFAKTTQQYFATAMRAVVCVSVTHFADCV